MLPIKQMENALGRGVNSPETSDGAYELMNEQHGVTTRKSCASPGSSGQANPQVQFLVDRQEQDSEVLHKQKEEYNQLMEEVRRFKQEYHHEDTGTELKTSSITDSSRCQNHRPQSTGESPIQEQSSENNQQLSSSRSSSDYYDDEDYDEELDQDLTQTDLQAPSIEKSYMESGLQHGQRLITFNNAQEDFVPAQEGSQAYPHKPAFMMAPGDQPLEGGPDRHQMAEGAHTNNKSMTIIQEEDLNLEESTINKHALAASNLKKSKMSRASGKAKRKKPGKRKKKHCKNSISIGQLQGDGGMGHQKMMAAHSGNIDNS